MGNYVVTFDLNGPAPTPAQIDRHMEAAGYVRARVMATVWHVGTGQPFEQLFAHLKALLGEDDRLLVVEAVDVMFRNLHVEPDPFVKSWNHHR